MNNLKICTARQKIEDLGNGVILEMVYIPGGTFMMGSPKNEADRCRDEVQHKVTLSPFFMSKYPVTQEQWEAIMGNNPSRFSMYKYDPVENVSWDDAVGFCKKLSEKTGKKYRLPTEAEWEYACRAGTTTPFYFGETITPDLVEYDIRYRRTFFPGRYIGRYEVVILPPNPFGLYDMHGNIWEWCQDWYGDYPTGAVTNPSGPSFGSYRVIRGGTFCNNKACRSADRGSMILFDFLLHYVGFRLALSQVSK